MIPVAIHTHGGLRDRTLHVEVIDNPDITPGALMVSLYESLLETNTYSAELHLRAARHRGHRWLS